MKWALLIYGDPAWDSMPLDERRSFHAAHRDLHVDEDAVGRVGEVAHFRFRPANQAVTLRRVDGSTVRAEGPSNDTSANLRALYVVEADALESALDLASTLPGLARGGTVEVWPIVDARPTGSRGEHGRGEMDH